MSIVSAVFDYISSQPSIVDELGRYDFGSGDAPALFTVEPAPEDSGAPLIVIQQPTGNEGTARDRTHKGGQAFIDVKLWGNKTDSEKKIRDLADTIWTTLDRADLTVSGFEFVNCIATPPQRLADPDGFPGYIVPLQVTVRTL